MKQKVILDKIFNEVETVILRRQHPVTGLLPASTAINEHGDYTDAWVRDNVYSVMSVWGLRLALRRVGDSERGDQLEQAIIKLMRGLLVSMMRQASKVEMFKHSLDQFDALHAKYDTRSGLEVVADDAWGHLQIDATSLYLLMLAQMTASGLRIVRTYSEVDFVQNLVYYISSAYRTPDFGIWERGNKINNGKTEINASSVGMAKAALQALDGFNLFGKNASPRAVIHSVADAISLARETLKALLPRESLSKETDAALLSIIGFPAFAIGDKALVSRTRDEILTKLGGKYGCKRFLWDGHQTAIEESSRLYYEHSELSTFEHVESEWPLFFTYLYIHALFDGNESTARHYREKLESLMVEVNGFRLLPELYYVPHDRIDAEKRSPGSQLREPNENVPLVWAQSLYIFGLLLDEGLVTRDDLDPLRMRRRARQFRQNQVALVVLAENAEVKQHLAQHGVIAETLKDILPNRVLSAPNLVDIYTHVGANKSLELSGRPRRRLQSLATSQIYEINGQPCLCLSWIQSEQDDYRSLDARLMAETIEREIAHLRNQWSSREVAVYTWMVSSQFMEAQDNHVFYQTLRNLQLRTRHEQVGYASANLACRASRVSRFWLSDFTLPTSPPMTTESELDSRFDDRSGFDEATQGLLECMALEDDITCFRTLCAFLKEHPLTGSIEGAGQTVSVRVLVQHLYADAQRKGYWLVARYCYVLLGHFHIDLADGLTMLVTQHISVVIGKDKFDYLTIDSPMLNAEIADSINKLYDNPLERALVQEVLAIFGTIMRTEPGLFEGLRSIRVQTLMMLCAEASDNTTDMDILLTLGGLPPVDLVNRVREILADQHEAFTRRLKSALPETDLKHQSGIYGVATDWFEWRVARGSITRFDDQFLEAFWQSLSQARTLVFGDRGSQEFQLDCDLVRRSMTAGEVSFANHVDDLTQQLHPTYYKSAVIEAMYDFTEYCQAHPDARFEEPIVFAELLERAAKSFVWDTGAIELGKRDLDVLLEQPPQVLKKYTTQVFDDMAYSPVMEEEPSSAP